MDRSPDAASGPPFHRPFHPRGPAASAVVAPAAALLLAAVVVLGAAPAPATAQETEETLEERTARVHDEALVWDGHNDLPWRIRGETNLDIEAMDLETRLDEGHTDLPRLAESGLDAQFWSVYVPTDFVGANATAAVLEQIDLLERLADRYPDRLEMAYTADDVERIAAEGKIASLAGMEGGHAISNSLPVLRELYEAGARYLTLTHSATLAWADAAGDTVVHGGLTEFGEKVVREMNRLGMLVDLSHVTDDVMKDALDVSRAPVIFSHSSARAVADHPRNVPDDVLRRMPENGGVVMVTFVSAYLTQEGAEIQRDLLTVRRDLQEQYADSAEVERAYQRWLEENQVPRGDVGTVVDHIDHIVEVAGVDHVGVGSDWDGTSTVPEGLDDVSTLPNLTEELLRRGYTDEEVGKILGGNVLRAMREAERVSAELRETEPVPFDRLPYAGVRFGEENTGDGGDR